MIEDNGIGVPPVQGTRIFELFRRLHTDSEYPGIGMGLTIARRIVESHGGSIGVQPAGGAGGSVFWLTLSKQHRENERG
jgi:signal transduction histidine kinase